MSLFRKKPVVIEARHWDGSAESANFIIAWIRLNGGIARWHPEVRKAITPYREGDTNELVTPAHIDINTLEGTVRASIGDWVIMGVQGEFYPCKPDIFDETYEKVAV